MAIKWPRPHWPGDPKPGDPPKPRPTIGAPRAVRPEIYGVMPVAQVESLLRREKMPAPFTRRMRVINLLSAVTLRKIEDTMLAPFTTMDIHHVLDEQISQDAIIAMLDNKNLATALETGNLQPLWVESKKKPLLRKGFEQGWIQRFNTTPFDPICVMLAMRAKLMLDVVDELGHSYDLLRAIGMGWIDFGDIPGEEAGDPDAYVPPIIDQPIDYPDLPPDPVPGDPDYVPGPGEPGYIPPEDLVPGDPGYTPGPGDPGYIPPGDLVPGDPGYVPGPDDQAYIPPPDRVPGDPGYEGVPGEPPGYPAGWDEAIHPGHPDYEPGPGEGGYAYPSSPGGGFYGGDYGPGGSGAPGGPPGAGGIYGSLAPPLTLGYGPGSLLSGGWTAANKPPAAWNCCYDYTNPIAYVGIEYETTNMGLSEEQTLSVHNADPSCGGYNYEWLIIQGGGELSAASGLSVQYTAPASGHNCPGDTEIKLYCGGVVMTDLVITINYNYAISYNYGTSAATITRNDSELVYVTANNTPLTWVVEGTGFSLEHAETTGAGNVLHADETACGSATITITGCDEQSAVGYVRCTTGQWGNFVNGCALSGEPDSKVCEYSILKMTKILGKYEQTQHIETTERAGAAGGCDEWGGDCSSVGDITDCMDWTCQDFFATWWNCTTWCCKFSTPGHCAQQANNCCLGNTVLKYREWVC